MHSKYRTQRIITALAVLVTIGINVAYGVYERYQSIEEPSGASVRSERAVEHDGVLAEVALEELEVKGRAPRTGYDRDRFSPSWGRDSGCDTRNIVLQRDLQDVRVNDKCQVVTGTLDDPYTGNTIIFQRGSETSADVHIDHVVSVSDAWQKGAQQLSYGRRYEFYNDPLNLLATSGSANSQKGASDAASWLPPNRAYRCDFVARQIAVKGKYDLWVTGPEYGAMSRILSGCDNQLLPQQ